MRDGPKERLAFLDVARGLAAGHVILEHGLRAWLPGYSEWAFRYMDLRLAPIILFLLVSGFSIPISLEQGGSCTRFWLRRIFRLFPAYWLSIGLAYGYCALCRQEGVGVPPRDGSDWLLNLTMLQGFFGRPHVWGVFWTLQTELVVYAACSLLFACGALKRTAWIAGLAIAGYAAIGLARPLLAGLPFGVGGYRFLYFAPLIGLIARRRYEGRLGWKALVALASAFVLALLAVWLVNHALFPKEMTAVCLWDLGRSWGIPCACFVLLLAARGSRMPAQACWLGRVSYSLYLLHPLVMMLLTPLGWPVWALLPCLLIATLLLAEAAYRYIEAPGIAMGRAIERRLFPAARGTTRPEAASARRAA